MCIDAVNKINIYGVDIFDKLVNILFVLARSGENRDPQKCRSHNHTYFEIHYVAKGNMLYEVDNASVEVSAGQYIIVTPRQVHRVLDHSDDYIKYSVAFEIEKNCEIYSLFNSKRKRIFQITTDLKNGFDFVTRQANKRGAYCEFLIKKRLNEMVYIIADQLANGKGLKVNKEFSDDRLLKAKKYIEDNSNIFFSCNEVAQYCGISTKQLGRLFQKYRNESLLEFIHVQKISDARKLLLNTDELQETISKNLGFSSVHYFNKFFLHEVGMTPDDYRKKHSKVNNGRKKND
ncbi:MAG: AraC family transcriptional regulator, partial [Clostridia bacterium]|nr:AraC family transcriptional regulator [Clostridia bacterium]